MQLATQARDLVDTRHTVVSVASFSIPQPQNLSEQGASRVGSAAPSTSTGLSLKIIFVSPSTSSCKTRAESFFPVDDALEWNLFFV